MSFQFVISIEECTNDFLTQAMRPLVDEVRKLLYQFTNTSKSVLLACGYERECIHLASVLRSFLESPLNVSVNLSRSTEAELICDLQKLKAFEVAESIELDYEMSDNDKIPKCNCLSEFLGRLEQLPFGLSILIVPAEVVQKSPQSSKLTRVLHLGKFSIFTCSPLSHKLGGVEEMAPPIIEKTPNTLTEASRLAPALEAQVATFLEALNIVSVTGGGELEPLFTKIEQSLNELETCISEQRRTHEVRGSHFFRFLNSAVQVAQLETEIDDIVQVLSKSLPKEPRNPGVCIEVEAFYFSQKKQSWVVKVKGNKNFTLRNVKAYLSESDMELTSFQVIQRGIVIEKTIEMDYTSEYFDKHVILKNHEAIVSPPCVISPVVIHTLVIDEETIEVQAKNRSNILFRDITLSNSGVGYIRHIGTVLAFERIKVLIHKDAQQFDGHFFYFVDSDEIISNSIFYGDD